MFAAARPALSLRLKGAGPNADELAKYIQQLEQEMFECAKRLEFEKAAELRDEIEGPCVPAA